MINEVTNMTLDIIHTITWNGSEVVIYDLEQKN